jgi:single-stranded DNA-binding protein
MASISLAGTVTGKQGEAPVSVKTFDSGDSVATFSVVDREYVYAKKGEESLGQFYRVEVRGKAAQIAADRLQRGDKVAVHGQLVQREYNGKIYLDVKGSRITYLSSRKDETGAGDGDAF